MNPSLQFSGIICVGGDGIINEVSQLAIFSNNSLWALTTVGALMCNCVFLSCPSNFMRHLLFLSFFSR